MRLIDADIIIKSLKEASTDDYVMQFVAHAFISMIDAIPTAYDVDKVVEKIGRKSMDNTDGRLASHPKLMGSYISITSDAVDIIKQGGIE